MQKAVDARRGVADGMAVGVAAVFCIPCSKSRLKDRGAKERFTLPSMSAGMDDAVLPKDAAFREVFEYAVRR